MVKAIKVEDPNASQMHALKLTENGGGNGGAKKNDDPFGGGATNDPFGN